MAHTELPPPVRDLVEHHLDSAAAVDALLLLCEEDRGWTAVTVARELRIHIDQTMRILTRLTRSGLLKAQDDIFRFEPRTTALADAVALLAELYPTYRVAIVALIYARPTLPIRDFSDAFRLRHED